MGQNLFLLSKQVYILEPLPTLHSQKCILAKRPVRSIPKTVMKMLVTKTRKMVMVRVLFRLSRRFWLASSLRSRRAAMHIYKHIPKIATKREHKVQGTIVFLQFLHIKCIRLLMDFIPKATTFKPALAVFDYKQVSVN